MIKINFTRLSLTVSQLFFSMNNLSGEQHREKYVESLKNIHRLNNGEHVELNKNAGGKRRVKNI